MKAASLKNKNLGSKKTYGSKTNLGLELSFKKLQQRDKIVPRSHTSPWSGLTGMKILKTPTRLNPVATAQDKQTDGHIHLESESHEHGIFNSKPISEASPHSWREHHRFLDNPHYSLSGYQIKIMYRTLFTIYNVLFLCKIEPESFHNNLINNK